MRPNSLNPASGLLVDGSPRWEVLGQEMPLTSCPRDITDGVEDFAQIAEALGCVVTHEQQVRKEQLPLVVTDIAGIRLAFESAHAIT